MLARNRSRRRSGLSLIELLVLLAVLGVLLALAAIQGRAIAQRASERSVVNTFQQAVWQGATLAAARGFRTELVRDGDALEVRRVSTGAMLRRFELDPGASLNLQDGQVVVFTPPGSIVVETLDALPDPIEIVAAGTTYELEVSLIGEVRVR